MTTLRSPLFRSATAARNASKPSAGPCGILLSNAASGPVPTVARAGRAQRRFGWLLTALMLLGSSVAWAFPTVPSPQSQSVSYNLRTNVTPAATTIRSNLSYSITSYTRNGAVGDLFVGAGNTATFVSTTTGTGFTPAQGLYFKPAAGVALNTTVTFSFTATDTNGGGNQQQTTGPVTYTITIINNNPVAVADNGGTTTNTTAVPNINVLANDTDADDNGTSTLNKATVTLVGAQVGGTFTANTAAGANQGTISFTPTAGFAGTASVNYTVQDEKGQVSNQATLSITVTVPSPFMGVTITSSSNPINAGVALTLTVGVTNTGTGAVGATGVTRTVTGLPTGLTGVTFGGAGATGASYNSGAGSVTFTSGSTTLAQGGNTLNFTLNFTAPATASATPFTAVATVSATNQTNTSNPTFSLTQTITPIADVATTLTGPASAAQGGAVSFTVTYTNSGPSTAAGVTRTVTVPAGATGITATGGVVSGGGPFTITYAPSGGTMTSGQSDSFTFSYTAPTTGTTMNTVSNIATTTSQNGATANDQFTVTTALTAAADVTATISAPATAPAGSNVSFLPVIINTSGANGAANLIVSVFMGTGLTGVSASNFGTYDGVSGYVTFPTQTLGAGATF